MPIEKLCVICSKFFSIPPSRAKSATTCSRACKGVLLRDRFEANWVSKDCPACKRTYKHPTWQKLRVFCSENCKWASESAQWSAAEKSEGGFVMQKSDGYVAEYRPAHPFAAKRGWMQQHRLVMERVMRERCPLHPLMVELDGVAYLRPDVEVHHKDEQRANNDLSNLVACTRLAHRRIHSGLPVPPNEAWPHDGLIVQGKSLSETINGST